MARGSLVATSQVGEPALAVRPRPVFWTARFGKRFGSAAGVAIIGVVSLLISVAASVIASW